MEKQQINMINNNQNVMNKKGITPIIATILLIAIVVIVVAIIFVWSKNFVKESVQKKGLPAEQVCSQIKLQKSCNDGIMTLTNIGNVPVYQFDVKKNFAGITALQHSDDSIGVGESVEFDVGECPENYKIIPAIVGDVSGGK